MNQPTLILCEIGQPSYIESHSPFCLKVHRALKALDLSYTSRHANAPDAYKAFNATGQVPVLLVDGAPVSDSTNILRRLLSLRPGVLDESPEAWLYEELADTAVNGFLVAARWADPENWERTKVAYFGGAPKPVQWLIVPRIRRRVLRSLHARDVTRAGLAACWERFERLLDQLDARAPSDGYWLGERPSVADVALFGQLHSFRTPLTPGQHAAISARPRLTRWLDRCDRMNLRAPRILASASNG